MSLGKAIVHGKEKRKIYYGAKAHDRSCRNHGSCPYCESNRKHNEKKRKIAMEQRLKDKEESTNYEED